MNPYDRLPDAAAELFGQEATAEEAYGLLTVDVPVGSWVAALETARDQLGCTYFDWLSAVDEPGTGFRVCAHVVALGEGRVRRLLVRTTVPHGAAALPTATGVYAGAGWHERETHEMFGIDFTGHPHLVPLLLPEDFEGHPLRKDFVLAARVAKTWPGAKEPGEPAAGVAHGGPKRRTMLPPGVPDPNDWGPLKGQLPPAPARPARGARAAGAAPGERPARRARSVAEGSASQAAAAPAEPAKRTPDAPWEQPRGGAGESPATGPGADAAAKAAVPAEGEAPAQAAPQTATAVPADPPVPRPATADGETPAKPATGGTADDSRSARADRRENTPERPAEGGGGENR